jgi:CheY-like chemotaxis protein
MLACYLFVVLAGLAAGSSDTANGRPQDRYILVVDDDEDIRTTIQQILEEEGYQVLAAPNGEEALRLLALHPPPRLILLDLMMPVMDGARFKAKAAADPRLAAVPVVIISAGGGLANKAASMKAAGYLAKPIDLRTLMGTVEHWAGV